jgi:PAS domain S-box-containing protein
MSLGRETAGHLADSAAKAVGGHPDSLRQTLDGLSAPIYATDDRGTITYFNDACVELAGRTPEVGRDKWCVTWKLFSSDGDSLPHDQCPMAVAIREQRPVRNVEAIAERPDGTRVNFVPFPTPFFDSNGTLAGAINLLLDITTERGADYMRQQADKCRRLAGSVSDPGVTKTLDAMAQKYDAQASRISRRSKAVSLQD